MGKRRGLCFLKVRKPRHIGLRVVLHNIKKGTKKLLQLGIHGIAFTTDIHAHVKGHLIIAAPTGVQLLPGISDAVDEIGLDEAVDVLIVIRDLQSAVLNIPEDAAQAGTSTEQRAMQLERDCDDRYRAEWAKQHIGEDFEGAVSGLTDFGIYVMLPNTAEGLISLDSLPLDEYVTDDFFSMRAAGSNRTFTLGMPVRVTVTRADVNSGNIDFVLAETELKQ